MWEFLRLTHSKAGAETTRFVSMCVSMNAFNFSNTCFVNKSTNTMKDYCIFAQINHPQLSHPPNIHFAKSTQSTCLSKSSCLVGSATSIPMRPTATVFTCTLIRRRIAAAFGEDLALRSTDEIHACRPRLERCL